MSKTMKWHTRVMYLLVALALVAGLAMTVVPGSQVSADPGVLKWTKIATPSQADKVIVPNSDIYDIAVGLDGLAIYAIGVKDGNPVLWKSTNGGVTWLDKTTAAQTAEDLPKDVSFTKFSAVAVAPDDASFVAVSGTLSNGNAAVVVSKDSATKFVDTGLAAGVTNASPRCLDISKKYDSKRAIAVGTSNLALTEGKVFVVEVGGLGLSWKDATTYAGWKVSIAVTSLAVSPAYTTDKTIVAITNDGNFAYLQNLKWSTDKAWNASGGFSGFPVKIDDVIRFSDLALPSDYMAGSGATRVAFAILTGVDASTSEVVSRLYRIGNYTVSAPCGPTGSPLLASLAYYGTIAEGKAMIGQLGDGWDTTFNHAKPTGCCAGLQVWRTTEVTESCPKWSTASKKPSGQLSAIVAYSPDGKKAFTVSSGSGKSDESAFSLSTDGGAVWNQLSLIDTDIDYLSDAAVSPDCAVTYIVSVNTLESGEVCECDSVWRSTETGKWMRVWYGNLGSEQIGLLRLAADATDGVYVILGDKGTKNLKTSKNKGETWSSLSSLLWIQDFATETVNTIYALDSDGYVAKTTDGAWNWAAKVDTALASGHTIAVLPTGNVLVGPSAAGKKVAYSTDGGMSFSRTGALSSSAANAHVAFDSKYASNKTIYVAAGVGIYRWVIGTSTSWKDLEAKPTLTQMGGSGTTKLDVSYYGIVLGKSDGILYATYAYADGSDWYTGVARCLTPAVEVCCGALDWDYLHAGLTVKASSSSAQQFNLEVASLDICGYLTVDSTSKLWAIDNDPYAMADGKDGTLWAYEDMPPNNPPNIPSNPSPTNHAAGVSINPHLSWTGGDPDAGDTVTYDVYFGTSVTPPLVSNHQTATTYDPATLAYNTKYYWQIVATDSHGASATGPLWDFTTSSGAIIVVWNCPLGGQALIAPYPGAGRPFLSVAAACSGITVSAGAQLWGIYYLDETTGTWLWYIPGFASNTLTQLEPGKYYYLVVSGACTLQIPQG